MNTKHLREFRAIWTALVLVFAVTVVGQANAEQIISVGINGFNTNIAINNAIGQSFRVPYSTELENIEIWIKPELYVF